MAFGGFFGSVRSLKPGGAASEGFSQLEGRKLHSLARPMARPRIGRRNPTLDQAPSRHSSTAMLPASFGRQTSVNASSLVSAVIGTAFAVVVTPVSWWERAGDVECEFWVQGFGFRVYLCRCAVGWM